MHERKQHTTSVLPQAEQKASSSVPDAPVDDDDLLGTPSNCASTFSPSKILKGILKNALIIVDKDDIPAEAVPIGEPLDKTNAKLKSFLYNADGTPKDDKQKVAIRFSVGAPGSHGSTLPMGVIDQNMYQAAEDIDTVSSPSG